MPSVDAGASAGVEELIQAHARRSRGPAVNARRKLWPLHRGLRPVPRCASGDVALDRHLRSSDGPDSVAWRALTERPVV
jgi:hypothetical protein